MIKLKKLIREGIYGKFWWMDPRGKLQRIMKLGADTGHREAAIQILQIMGISPTNDVFNQMYNLGWVRLAYVGDQGLYILSYNNTPSNIQMKAIKDLAIEMRVDEIRNNSNPKQRIELF